MGRKTKQRKPIAAIESGVEMRPCSTTTSFGKAISLTATIRALEPGQSFRLDDPQWRRRVTATASFVGVSVRTTKDDNGMLLVTRLDEPTEA